MNKPFALTVWQKKQAALLYHFSSLDYLVGLQKQCHDILAFIDPTIDLAALQNRDSVLVDERWGSRDTSTNWSAGAWPLLKDLQLSIAKSIADRAFEIYRFTGVNFCARGLSEYSMNWMTLDEEERFEKMFEEMEGYARYIDRTLKNTSKISLWDDFLFTVAWQQFKIYFPKLPKFQVRTDIEGESGRIPIRTGVYVPQDDPHATLHFAWTGGGYGHLTKSATFNDLGLRAINALGRRDIWNNEGRMFEFLQENRSDPSLQQDPFYEDSFTPKLAPSLIARNAFTSRPCKWYFVEMVNDEFEDIVEEQPLRPQHARLRVEGGHVCPQSGYWLTAAKVGARRYFNAGEKMPVLGTAYGLTIWQWDADQST